MKTRLNRIRSWLADPGMPGQGVLHVHAAPVGCCATVGTGRLHDFITTVGGDPIGAETVGTMQGNAPEYSDRR